MYHVNYIERKGWRTTKKLSLSLQQLLEDITTVGGEVVSIDPNLGVFETSGFWITWKDIEIDQPTT